MVDVLDELEWRGLIAQHTDLDELRALMQEGPITFYTGYDPTAASLHHGHLVQIMVMRHLQMAGHKPLALVGGATGLIGDPRMSGERTLNEAKTVAEWSEKLRAQIERFLDFEGPAAARMVNNYDWTGEMTAISLLRDLGKHFRLGTMIAKDTVARRLASDEGISFTEFSYQLLQANDYLELYRRYGCVLETGGNDQWGNLIGGTDLIRKAEGKSVHVLTTPLITKADGTKFGKSEGGAIWLDADMMSPYAFYQFWLGTEDADVERLLKVFTFLGREQIAQLVAESAAAPHQRIGQRRLAAEVTTFVHGAEATAQVIAASEALFGKGDLRTLDGRTLRDATASLPSADVVLGETTIVDLLVDSGLEKGRGAARRTVASGGAYVNGEKAEDEDAPLTSADVLPGDLVLFRKGRRNMGVGHVK
ncbi:tyrosine--tRNA ligase [Boudabousia marimammalium]|uniref:Tyrosine--tRNA ligase n=1 Tax=Boudabousia marimammalium TaxID=156892 RepID=A0A1Q5PNN8_9ACTO|nr:tyrosine--tRNA ligase [Boudabousia marimammalium]OKL49198.1 tyrosine--tRNA ligase [Boudabousia marimammalium]